MVCQGPVEARRAEYVRLRDLIDRVALANKAGAVTGQERYLDEVIRQGLEADGLADVAALLERFATIPIETKWQEPKNLPALRPASLVPSSLSASTLVPSPLPDSVLAPGTAGRASLTSRTLH